MPPAAHDIVLNADKIDLVRAERPDLTTVLVTHHLEELPTSTSHALLLRDGRVLASGPAGDVLTTEAVSECFDHPITISRHTGRWTATAGPAAAGRTTG